MTWMEKQFNPEPKHLMLANVRANPEIQKFIAKPMFWLKTHVWLEVGEEFI